MVHVSRIFCNQLLLTKFCKNARKSRATWPMQVFDFFFTSCYRQMNVVKKTFSFRRGYCPTWIRFLYERNHNICQHFIHIHIGVYVAVKDNKTRPVVSCNSSPYMYGSNRDVLLSVLTSESILSRIWFTIICWTWRYCRYTAAKCCRNVLFGSTRQLASQVVCFFHFLRIDRNKVAKQKQYVWNRCFFL